MSATLSLLTLSKSWSSCSKDDLRRTLTNGYGTCLFNQLTQIFGGPKCGNGFVEVGEECDCGTIAECQALNGTQCCEGSTCKLKPSSECAAGECCRNCKFIAKGNLCRKAARTSCDISEFCTGSSGNCPDNFYVRDGSTCNRTTIDQGYCYEGQCKTLLGQCQGFWGNQSVVGDDLCSSIFNQRGTAGGNCGVSSTTTYVKCLKADVKCGLLQCTGGSDKPLFGGKLSSQTVSTKTLTIGSKTVSCKSASIDAGPDVPDPGLIQDGTKCGQNMVCSSNKCVNLDVLLNGTLPCSSGKNGQICSGRGICSSDSSCHCNSGYQLPDCFNKTQVIVTSQPPAAKTTSPSMTSSETAVKISPSGVGGSTSTPASNSASAYVSLPSSASPSVSQPQSSVSSTPTSGSLQQGSSGLLFSIFFLNLHAFLTGQTE